MASRARLIAPIALATLSVVVALSLGRVVDSSRFVAPVVLAAVLPHVVGALCRWRRRAGVLTLVAAALALVVYVLVRVSVSQSHQLFPGSATWHALDQQLSAGWHLLRSAPAPAPATNGAILLAIIVVWVMATLADWLAFSRQATLGAIAPALVFFVWTSTLGTADARVAATAGFCAAAGGFLLAQNVAVLDRRRSWLVSQGTSRAHWLLPASAIGAVAIVVGLLVAPALPGAGADPVLDFANPARDRTGGRSYRPSLAPFVDIGDKLEAVDNTELFTVRSPLRDYWRIAALDTYSNESGGQWTLSAEGDGNVSVGLPDGTPTGTLVQRYDIGPLGERWLPAAYRPVAISLADTLVVTSSGTIVTDRDSVSNLRYTVASRLPALPGTVKPEQQVATAKQVPAALEPYTRLPADLPPSIHDQAEQVVKAADATTPYAEAAALRDFFRAGSFVYDTTVGSDDSGNAIVTFLHDKRGFCVQFAGAYAVMARSLGIPARVAVGFTPGTIGADGTYHVTSHDAHAWPEVWLAGLGWTHLFDPTPGTSGTLAGGSNLPGEAPIVTTATPPPATTVPPVTQPPTTGGGGTPATTPGPAAGARPNVSTTSSDGATSPWLVAVLVVLALVLLAGGYVAAIVVAKARRRARRRDAADPVAAVSGAWEEALDRLREAHVAPDPALTPLELARVAPQHTTEEAEPPLRRLASAYTVTRYGESTPAPDDVRLAWCTVDELERALTADVGWRERWRRRLDPATLPRSGRR